MSTLTCGHAALNGTRKICVHIWESEEPDHLRYFTGNGKEYILICGPCMRDQELLATTLREICPDCALRIEEEGIWEGIGGTPTILELPSTLSFHHRTLTLGGISDDPLLDIQPFPGTGQSRWLGITLSGTLVDITFDEVVRVHPIATILVAAEGQPFTALQITPTGDLAVVYTPLGNHGAVVETATGKVRMTLVRDGYRTDVSPFPVAFFMNRQRLLMVYATRWNRLDIYDPWTGVSLTDRTFAPYVKGERHPEEAVDYFHGHLVVSPTHEWIADDGWIWSPVGNVATWNLTRWLETNPFESDRGESKRYLCQRAYFWGGALCWINEHTLAMWGYGEDDEWLLNAVHLFDVRTGQDAGWFPGPDISLYPNPTGNATWTARMIKVQQALTFDTYLFSSSEINGVQVWDIETGARLHHDPSFSPIRYHRGTKEFLSRLPDGTFQLSRLIEQP